LLNLAKLLADSGDLAGALELYRLGLTIDGRDANLHLGLGNMLLGAGRAKEAVMSLRRAWRAIHTTRRRIRL
jgi:Flp pilus assembly protein TadD